MLKNNMFLASILEGFGPRFGKVFGRFFGSKTQENCKNTNLTKTLKIVVFPRENWYFQGFEKLNLTKNCPKAFKICMFFETSIWEGFWEGLGRVLGGQNPWFSKFFRHFFDAKFRVQLGRAKTRKKTPTRAIIPWSSPRFGGMCGPGGKDLGWGEACLSLNFKPYLKIGL